MNQRLLDQKLYLKILSHGRLKRTHFFIFAFIELIQLKLKESHARKQMPLLSKRESTFQLISKSTSNYREGFKPNLFGPSVPFVQYQTSNRTAPKIGINMISSHQPDLSMSWSLRIETAKPGNKKARLTMIPKIPDPDWNIAVSRMPANTFTDKTNKVHHQYSDRAERPWKSTYLLKPLEIACPISIAVFLLFDVVVDRRLSRLRHLFQSQIQTNLDHRFFERFNDSSKNRKVCETVDCWTIWVIPSLGWIRWQVPRIPIHQDVASIMYPLRWKKLENAIFPLKALGISNENLYNTL